MLSEIKLALFFAVKAVAGKTGHEIQSLTQFRLILSSSAYSRVQFAFCSRLIHVHDENWIIFPGLGEFLNCFSRRFFFISDKRGLE